MANKYKYKRTNLDLVLNNDNLIEPQIKQYHAFCNAIRIKLDQTLQSHNLIQIRQDNLKIFQDVLNQKIEEKIKLLLYCLYKYDEKNDKLVKAFKIKSSIRSNQIKQIDSQQLHIGDIEIKQEPLDYQHFRQIFQQLQELNDNGIQQKMIEQIELLRNQNNQQKILISNLQNQKVAIEVDFKQHYYDVLLQMNNLINRRAQPRQINLQIKQKLQILETKDKQNQTTINQLKKQMKLHIQTAEYLRKEYSAAQAQVSYLKKELKDTIKTMSKMISQLQNYIKQFTESEKLRKQGFILQFFNQNINKLDQKNQNFKQKQQIIDYFNYIDRSLFTSSELLINYFPIQQFLTQQIQKHSRKQIIKTNLLYKFDKFDNPFGNYLKQIQSSFIILFKLHNNRVCGGYCSGKKQGQSSFLFTYLNIGKVFNKNPKCQKNNGWIYSDNSLVFGNSQMIVMNKSNGKFKSNFNTFGKKYFEVNRTSDFWQECVQNNIIQFQQMEIHSIMF